MLLDVTKCPIATKFVAPLAKQDSHESRRLWHGVSQALLLQDYEKASTEKAIIEDQQRALTKLREEGDIEWRPKFFTRASDGFWHLVDRHVLKHTPSELYGHLHDFFLRHYGLGTQFRG